MQMGQNLIAVDVGNSRIKLGLFTGPPSTPGALPEPSATLELEHQGDVLASSGVGTEWLTPYASATASIATVHRGGGELAGELLASVGIAAAPALDYRVLPLATRVRSPERVGIDRLLAALAANHIRRPNTPAVVVDVGTAITVDLVAADGAFEGGAILPGIRMASRALNSYTDALPDVAMHRLEESPPAVGRSTEEAVCSGIFWGAVGAIREVIARQRDGLTAAPQLFLTGGAAPSIARLLADEDTPVRYFPHLVLAGIAISAAAPTDSGE